MYLENLNKESNKVLTLETRTHSFNVGIARDYSPNMALWLGHLAFWAHKNLANNKHIHDGLVWCFDTLEAIGDYFPYFTKRQIERLINNSIQEGLVVKGNYNQTKYDRTVWYALTPKAYFYFPHLVNDKYINSLFLSISPNGEIDFAEFGNGFRQTVTPIPDTDPSSINKDIESPKIKLKSQEAIERNYDFLDTSKSDETFEVFWSVYPVKKNKNRAKCAWYSQGCEKTHKEIIEKLREQINKDRQYLDGFAPNPDKYIMQERWNDEIQTRKKKSVAEKVDHTTRDWATKIKRHLI